MFRLSAGDGHNCCDGGLIAKIGEEILPLDALKNTLTGEGELFLRSNCCDEHLLEYCDGDVSVNIEVFHRCDPSRDQRKERGAKLGHQGVRPVK
jgi:hypothetical protein